MSVSIRSVQQYTRHNEHGVCHCASCLSFRKTTKTVDPTDAASIDRQNFWANYGR